MNEIYRWRINILPHENGKFTAPDAHGTYIVLKLKTFKIQEEEEQQQEQEHQEQVGQVTIITVRLHQVCSSLYIYIYIYIYIYMFACLPYHWFQDSVRLCYVTL